MVLPAWMAASKSPVMPIDKVSKWGKFKAAFSSSNNARALFDELKAALNLPQFDTLSMGMTGDLEAAIHAGSTMVRVGTAIFGGRNYAA